MLAETMHTSALCLLYVAANGRRRALLEDALVPMLREGDAPSRRERRVAPLPIDFEDRRRASSWPNPAASTGERDIVIHFLAWHLSPLPLLRVLIDGPCPTPGRTRNWRTIGPSIDSRLSGRATHWQTASTRCINASACDFCSCSMTSRNFSMRRRTGRTWRTAKPQVDTAIGLAWSEDLFIDEVNDGRSSLRDS